MATIQKEIAIERNKDTVWDEIRDVGEIHKRLVPGFVLDWKLEGDWRTVTFANGIVVRELIVAVDDKSCRHAWSAHGAALTHHNASVQVFADGDDKCRVVWIADLMPNEVADSIAEMIQHGLNIMKQTLETNPTRWLTPAGKRPHLIKETRARSLVVESAIPRLIDLAV
jgi:carbon monoxide dehydrogenase subunit G